MYTLRVKAQSKRLEKIETLEKNIAQSIEVIPTTPKGAKIEVERENKTYRC